MHVVAAPLESLRGSALQPLLEQERKDYLRTYRWNFDYTAKLVGDLVSTRGLSGVALLAGGEAVGYSFFVLDRQKAVIGDAYVRSPYATPANERLLMSATLDAIGRATTVRRVEGQPMMLRYPYSHPRAQRFERLYLEVPIAEVRWPEEFQMPVGFRVETWSWRHEGAAGMVLYDAYRGHVDAEINDHYMGQGSATDYLRNLLTYPGCGVFSPEASFLILDEARSTPCAVLCASEIQPGVGHITQLCVERAVHGRGLGRALLYAALSRFAEKKWEWATLSVTGANERAIGLYTRAGFVERVRLHAYVWPQWPH